VSSQTTDQMIAGYFLATTKAISTLFSEDLLPHSLVIIYSTIDTCGLLDAPPQQAAATSASFKAWVKKYVLTYPGLEFNEVDLWGARCAVLHTFTSESDLSNAGKARQLQYYTGDRSASHVQQLISFTKSHEAGKHLPVHYGDLADAVFEGMKAFVPDLAASCQTSSAHLARLRNVIQAHLYDPGSDNSYSESAKTARI
jgi:hypothetical protein